MPAVSIIIPVYNSEKFLPNIVDCVMQQTFQDFELILVDDGSTDGSAAICDGYAQADKRVVVIHQENGGICAARNKGLRVAKGEYIAFSDHDDLLLPQLFEDNLKLALEHDADVVKFGYRVNKVYANGKEISRMVASEEKKVVTGDQLTDFFGKAREYGFFLVIWNGLYKREFLKDNGIQFDEKIRFGYEDWDFNYQIYPHITKLVMNPKMYYQYMMRFGISTFTKFYPERLMGCVRTTERETTMYQALGIKDRSPGAAAACLIELALQLNHPNCTMNGREKANFFSSMRNRPLFSDLLKADRRALSKTKLVVSMLFRHRWYGLLLFLSKVYKPYAEYKLRKAR